jgi:preprotein translocase subunit SecA
MTPLLEACGLSVSSISSALDQAERASRYDASVVYVTAKELLADYLRDSIGAARDAVQAQQRFLRWSGAKATGNAPTDAQPCLRRGLHSAIVDEADSVLIDEAVTPLILAVPRQSRGLADATRQISLIAARLEPGADYTPRPQTQTVVLHESAVALLDEAAAALPALWQPAERREELLRQALVVRCFYRTGHHYVVQEGQVVLLDESTGRMTPGRSLTAGLHQAIEAAEGLEITDPNQSLTQMSFQTFFRRFRRLSGCSGTVWEARHELWRIYERVIVRVPTHRPRITHYRDPVLTLTGAHKWDRIAREVADLVERGRPVLVGVRSVPSSEALARVLAEHACPARVLNALTHQEEAQIIAQAGQGGTVTIATNMAGRGTDVKLGPGVAERGGLHVIIAESNESGRIDRQLAGRCGRQGDPGSVSIYQCMTDDLAIRMMPDWLRRLVLAVGRRSAGRSSFLARCAFRQAQRRAEALAYQRRVGVLKIDQWMRSALPFEGRASERGS